MAQLFRPGANSIAIIVVVATFAVPVGAVAVSYVIWNSPYATDQYLTPAQPVPFSHAHHVGDLGIDCRMCHAGVEKAAFAGVPATHICMTCHSQIWTNARMLAPVRASLASNIPLHWKRVGRLPAYVYFDHSVHVDNGVGCSSCHGDMTHMQMTYQPNAFSMDFCLSCHQAPQKFLRPRDKIVDMQWQPPADQDKIGRKLLAQYHINTSGLLTDCSTCHR